MIPKGVRWLVIVLIVAVGGYAVLISWRNDGQQTGWVNTEYGPLGPADRDLLVKVRQAGLWEMPTSQEATTRATQPRVKEIAGFIMNEHHDLDQKTVDTAKQLGVELPNLPSNVQQLWMQEITSKSGADYDATYVQRLRQAHGIVLPILAQVRVGTRNSMIRAFAEDATAFVTRHVTYLESTGLVNFAALPEPSTQSAPTYSAVITRAALVTIGLCVAGLLMLFLLLNRRHKVRQTKTVARHGRKKVSDDEAPTGPITLDGRAPPRSRRARV